MVIGVDVYNCCCYATFTDRAFIYIIVVLTCVGIWLPCTYVQQILMLCFFVWTLQTFAELLEMQGIDGRIKLIALYEDVIAVSKWMHG